MNFSVRNLYGRLLLWFLAANILTLFVSVFVTEHFARLAYVAEPDWAQLAQGADAAYRHGGAAALEDWNQHRHREGIDANLYEGEQALLPRPPLPPVRHHLDRLLSEDSVVLRPRPDLMLAGERVLGADGVTRHLVAIRGPRPPHARIEQLLVVQIGLSLLVIGALGWWIARSIARPVAALQAATRRMAAGELSARVGGCWASGRDELARLAADFDRMAMRIEALVAQERGVLQDVSHELRSPLARLHLLLDLARRTPADEAAPHFARAEREIERLDRIIGEALALSRMEAELPGMAPERVDLAALAQSRINACSIEADARGIVVALHAETAVSTDGSAALLERALDNLLANAIKFSDAGGTVEVRLARDGGDACLSVRDHGPGVPEAELAALARPFFRGANAARAEGHGLGLAIVQRIVRAHGGSLDAVNADGGGLRVTLRLPAAV